MLAITGVAKAQQWTEIHTGFTEYLYDICCVDSNNVLACGPNGLIIKTTDGGQTWNRKNSNTESSLYLLKFANDNIGFACGDGVFLKTTDGGENWTILETNHEMGFEFYQTNLFLVDPDTVYISDSYNNLWKSIDGGENFEKILDLQYTVDEFYKFDMFFEDNFGYLIGYGDFGVFHTYLTVFKTMDYGNTWETIEFPECESMLSAVHFMDKDRIRLYGYFNTSPDNYFGLLETTNGMGSYSLQLPTGLYEQLPDPWGLGNYITFPTENTGCFVNNLVSIKQPSYLDSYACLTLNNGETWTEFSNGINSSNHLWAVDGVNTVFYISASHGIIYKTDITEVIYEVGDNGNCPLNLFPNPTNNNIIITLGLFAGDSDLFTVELSSISGKIVLNESFRGNSTVLDMEDLPSGIYVLSVKGNAFLHRQTIIKTE